MAGGEDAHNAQYGLCIVGSLSHSGAIGLVPERKLPIVIGRHIHPTVPVTNRDKKLASFTSPLISRFERLER